MDFQQRFRQLDQLLDNYTWLWRPQPFKELRPSWCEQQPELCEALLALSDAQLQALTGDKNQLLSMLGRYLPELGELAYSTELPATTGVEQPQPGPHFAAGIPGRKWQQIGAFSAAIDGMDAPLLEWCGGKGHLGRLLAYQWRQPVLTLEWDAALCEGGQRMAERVGVAQQFYRTDVLSHASEKLMAGRHAVALHACGELHRSLVRRTVSQQLPAVDIAPCCFHLYGAAQYRPLTDGARLQLSRDDRRLAVTETVTAVGREVHLRDKEMAWKLGFDLLQRKLSGAGDYRPIKPIEKSWLKLGFEGFCRALAEREGIALPEGIAWDSYENAGWRRQRETMRLSLVRHAFRRAIELWLVLDLACYLENHGYRVRLGTFCERELTPRNILLSARRELGKVQDSE